MRGKNKGAAHPGYKGGAGLRGNYFRILRRDHPRADANGYVKRSVLVAEQMLGRAISRSEIVHHKNSDTTDDRPENLEVIDSSSEHARRHQIERNRRIRFGGFKNGNAVLTPETLAELRALAGSIPKAQLARRFGVSRNTVKRAIAGKTYRKD